MFGIVFNMAEGLCFRNMAESLLAHFNIFKYEDKIAKSDERKEI